MNLRRAALAGGLDSQQGEGRRNLEGAGVIILLGVFAQNIRRPAVWRRP
jgi:hypothetical protein